MSIPEFDPKELTIVGETPGMFGGPVIPVYDYPGSPKEALKPLYEGDGNWGSDRPD